MNSRTIFPPWRATLWILLTFTLSGALALFGGSRADVSIKPRTGTNPKLSTQLADLARAVPQRTTAPAPQERAAAAAAFSVSFLPQPSRDAITAGRMKITTGGEVQVYIEMNGLSEENLSQLRSFGVTVQIVGRPKPDEAKGEVLSAVPTVQGLLPIEMINAVAGLPAVRFIRLPDYGYTNSGSVQSEGDALLQAQVVRQQYGLDGSGIRIGVISDGIGGIFATNCTNCGATSDNPSPILAGDLPEATGTRDSNGVLTAVTGGIVATSFRADADLAPTSSNTTSDVASEGTAMLEIVYDLAPGAQLYFANAQTSMEFQQAVAWIDQNTDVGVDDFSWITPPFDGTSDISTNTANQLNTDANPVRGYFTSVGNAALYHWEEPWTDSGQNLLLRCPPSQGGYADPGDAQLFQATEKTKDGTNRGPYVDNPFVLPNGATVTVFLTWNDPFAGSSNDYDLFLYLAQGGSLTPLRCSVVTQDGTKPPLEAASYTNTSGTTQQINILIQNYNNQAAPRTFDMFVLQRNPNYYTPSGSVQAQSDAGGSPVSVVSVGATLARTDEDGNAPATRIEPYSSQGPTEATPQAEARMKPDVTATDGVSITGAGGFGVTDGASTYFHGTSAAAPHAAAVASLALQAAPCLLSSSTVKTPAEARAALRGFLTDTAVHLSDVSESAPNNIEGHGLLDALAAVTRSMPTAHAGDNQTVNATSENGATVSLSGTGTDPNSCPLTFNWSGDCGTATGANASLSCPAGINTEHLTVTNGGATTGLPTSNVQITVSDFDATASPTTATVQAGQSASFSIALAPKFGDFTDPVSLACAGLPSLSSCSFSPASVTPGSGSSTSTLTISTTAASALPPSATPGDPGPWLLAAWFGLLFLLATISLVSRKNGKKFAMGIASCALFLLLLAPVFSCGGGGSGSSDNNPAPPSNPGTPAGTYAVTVTGSSNQLQHTATVTLTVQD